MKSLDNNKRVYLMQLAALINKQSAKSARIWCEKNELAIYKDSSGCFVYESELELVYYKPTIITYMKKYGDKWRDYFELFLNKELYSTLQLRVREELCSNTSAKSGIATKFNKRFNK